MYTICIKQQSLPRSSSTTSWKHHPHPMICKEWFTIPLELPKRYSIHQTIMYTSTLIHTAFTLNEEDSEAWTQHSALLKTSYSTEVLVTLKQDLGSSWRLHADRPQCWNKENFMFCYQPRLPNTTHYRIKTRTTLNEVLIHRSKHHTMAIRFTTKAKRTLYTSALRYLQTTDCIKSIEGNPVHTHEFTTNNTE